MRLLPALANVLGIPALYAIGRLFGGHRIGLLAALLFALHPFEIWHAQDVRNYAIWGGSERRDVGARPPRAANAS